MKAAEQFVGGASCGKVALVTGGAVRIGRAISLAFAEAGFSVVVHCNRSVAAARRLAREINSSAQASPSSASSAPRAWALQCDLSDPTACDSLVGSALALAGRIDVLVNNAAVFARTPLADATADDFEAVWRVNALAPALLARAFARSRTTPESGKNGAPQIPRAIVNILDQRLARPMGGCAPYAMSKGALEAFTKAAAVELAPGVAVNAVAPGAVLAPTRSSGVHEPAGAALLASRPSPADVAAAVLWLATRKCVTGQTIFVDSGQHLA